MSLRQNKKIQNKPGNTQGRGTGNVCQLSKDMVLVENLYRDGGVFLLMHGSRGGVKIY